ncbi:MAG: HEPN domain-containing protein, partial [Thermoanaerobaculia bacterium]
IFWKNGKARSRFIDKVVDLRNYLTHYSHDRREKATIKPETMVELLELLRALFEINMLQLLGFDEDDVRAVIDNNNRLQQLKER